MILTEQETMPYYYLIESEASYMPFLRDPVENLLLSYYNIQFSITFFQYFPPFKLEAVNVTIFNGFDIQFAFFSITNF